MSQPAPKKRYLDEDHGPVRKIPTPEGVPLQFTVAGASDRGGAFLLDAVIIMLILLAIIIPLSFAQYFQPSMGALTLILLFVFRNFYFSGSEILFRGRTIGKRAIGLQVIDRNGRALRIESIFARNLTREIEIFLPLSILLGGESVLPFLPPWARLVMLGWVVLFLLFPFFSRDRLRMGDLLAGTMVVRAPKRTLLPDLTQTVAAAEIEEDRRFRFTAEQLEAYGIYELQVLEKILRQKNSPKDTITAVAEKIAEKISYEGSLEPNLDFLTAFYRAQRAYLEGRLLMGDKREDKKAAAERRGGSHRA